MNPPQKVRHCLRKSLKDRNSRSGKRKRPSSSDVVSCPQIRTSANIQRVGSREWTMGKFLGFVGGILSGDHWRVWGLVSHPADHGEGMVIDGPRTIRRKPWSACRLGLQTGTHFTIALTRTVPLEWNSRFRLRSTVVLLPAVAGYRDEGPTRFVALGVNHHDLYVIRSLPLLSLLLL